MNENRNHPTTGNNLSSVLGIAAVLIALYAASLHSYNLFHSFAEIFSIVIAAGIFMVAWNSRNLLENNYLLFLGIAYLFIAGIDFIHMLAYKGMGVFTGYTANLPTQLWIGARYLESISLLAAPLLLGRKVNTRFLIAGYGAVVVIFLLSIFYWDVFPTAFIEGVGLTRFKVTSEYIISLILLGSLAFLYAKRDYFDPGVLRLLVASVVVTVASEMSFTLYVDPYGLLNQTGHFLKIISFYLVYKAIIETGLAKPYNLLFRDLKQSEENLAVTLRSIGDGVITTDTDGNVAMMNRVAEYLTGWSQDEAAGLPMPEVFYIINEATRERCKNPVEVVLRTGEPTGLENHTILIAKDGTERSVDDSCAPIRDASGNIIGAVLVFRDVTESKRAEAERRKLTDRIQMLMESTDEGIYGIDTEGGCIFINRAASRMTGYGFEEAIDKNMHELLHHSHSDGSPYPVGECPVFRAFRVGEGTRIDTEVFWRKDGTSFPVEYSSYPIIEDGAIKGAVVTFTDITGRKQAEELSNALDDINVAISSTLDFDMIMRHVIVKAAEAIAAETAVTVIRETDYWTVKYVHGLPKELISKRLDDGAGSATTLAARNKRPVTISDAFNDPRVDRAAVEPHNIRSILAIPIIIREDVIGVISFNYHSAPVAFSEAQVDFANKLAASASLALENAKLYQEQRHIADTLQSAILAMPQDVRGIELSHLYRSATEAAKVGGDFYDFFELADGNIGFIIGDVSGKGLQAAATAFVAKSTMRAFAYLDPDPAYVLGQANNVISGQLGSNQFIAVIYGIIDTTTGRALMGSAGHPDPFICSSSGCDKLTARRNPPLGVFPEGTFDLFETTLQPGDIMLLYTDGLIEAKLDGELFGEDRVRRVLDMVGHKPTGDIVTALLTSAEEFSQNRLLDDMAIVAFRYRGVAESDTIIAQQESEQLI